VVRARSEERTVHLIGDVVTLGRVFGYLSLLTLGGGMAAYPELCSLVVDVHKWLTLPQLDHLYGVGQAAPGPNMAIVSVGAVTAGLPGAVVSFIAYLGPPALLALIVGRLWTRLRGRPWFVAVQRGLAPVSVGLLLAGCLTFAKGAVDGWTSWAIAATVFVVVLRTKINPSLLVLAGAVAGIVAFVFA
jgi:chromate transporter